MIRPKETMLQRFKSAQKHMDVSNIIEFVKNKQNDSGKIMILDPPYQRNSIWDTEKKAGFINSLLQGINSHNIILNIDDNNNYICIDGKQRIISIMEFTQNEFHVCVHDTTYYYSKIPEDNEDSDIEVLQNNDKINFDRFPISVDEYLGLTYEQQVDIFNRIQQGVALTKGELIAAQFTKDVLAIHFSKYCDDNEKLFCKFPIIFGSAKNTANRKNHYLFVMKIMNMVSKNSLKIPKPDQIEKYIKSIKNIQTIKNEIAKINDLLKLCFDKELLCHKSITSKLNNGFIIMVCMSINKMFCNKFNKCDKHMMLSAIRKLYRETNLKDTNNSKNTNVNETKIKLGINTVANTEKFIKRLKMYYDSLSKKSIEISDEEISEENNEEISDDPDKNNSSDEISNEISNDAESDAENSSGSDNDRIIKSAPKKRNGKVIVKKAIKNK